MFFALLSALLAIMLLVLSGVMFLVVLVIMFYVLLSKKQQPEVEDEVEVADETQAAELNVNGAAQPAEVETKNGAVEKEKILAEVTEKAQLSSEVDNEQAELDDKFMGMAIEMVLLA